MLDAWLKVAYEVETRRSAEFEMAGLMEQIPTLELRKLAAGTPAAELYTHMEKKGSSLDSAPCSSDGDEKTWLSKFQGTSLFEQAVALETEMLEAEAAGIAQRMEEDSHPRPYQVQDQIRLKKRLLELELAKQTAGSATAPPPGEPAQGAGAPGDVPAEGVQDSSQGLGGGVAKAAMAQWSDQMGRALARSQFEKQARVEVLLKVGSAAGVCMAKTALPNFAALGGMASKALGAAKPLASKVLGAAKPLASKVLGAAAAHPGLAGAALGAPVGALAGGPEHRIGGALGGAALGATAGNMAAAAAPARLMAHKPVLLLKAGSAAGLASKVLGAAAAHPELAGAALGAPVGALNGGPEHRIGGALGGAALGALGGATLRLG